MQNNLSSTQKSVQNGLSKIQNPPDQFVKVFGEKEEELSLAKINTISKL